jgi:hypothetical protein
MVLQTLHHISKYMCNPSGTHIHTCTHIYTRELLERSSARQSSKICSINLCNIFLMSYAKLLQISALISRVRDISADITRAWIIGKNISNKAYIHTFSNQGHGQTQSRLVEACCMLPAHKLTSVCAHLESWLQIFIPGFLLPCAIHTLRQSAGGLSGAASGQSITPLR